jgi:ABC-type branched-subunit amino acid transport system ATPase component
VAHTLEVREVSLRFGGVRALTDVSFGVNDGELFSIIGPNGAGKTSMINCISGRYRPGKTSPHSIPTPGPGLALAALSRTSRCFSI